MSIWMQIKNRVALSVLSLIGKQLARVYKTVAEDDRQIKASYTRGDIEILLLSFLV